MSSNIVIFSLFAWQFSLMNCLNIDFREVLTINSAENLKCTQQSGYFINELENSAIWASKMFDSSSKLPSGLFQGSTLGFGHYDQCLEIKEEFNGEPFQGKYCIASFNLKISPENPGNIWGYVQNFTNRRFTRERNKIRSAFCIPSGCTESDLQDHLRTLARKYENHQVGIEVEIPPGSCQIKKSYTYDFYDLMFLLIIFTIVILVIISTISDVSGIFKQDTKLQLVAKSFSLDYNWKMIFEEHDDVDNLNSIHGMRALATLVVITTHIVHAILQLPMFNLLEMEKWYRSWFPRTFLNFHSGIDTFFAMSAFLTAYTMFQNLDKEKPFNIFKFYFHRLIRLVPLNLIMIFFYATIFIKMGDGPIWREIVSLEQEKCLKNWWATIFYLNNYIRSDKICLVQTWFLSASLQMFVFTPPIVIYLYRNPMKGIFMTLSMILLFTGITFYQIYSSDMDPIMNFTIIGAEDFEGDTFRFSYIPTHTRAGAYLMGILTAYFRFQIKKKGLKLNKIVMDVTYFIAMIFMFTTIHVSAKYVVDYPKTRFEAAAFSSVHHLVMAFVTCYGIIALSTGFAEYTNGAFAWKRFIPFSKITYSLNMCNFVIVIYSLAVTKTPPDISDTFLFCHLISKVVITYLVALVIYLCFEVPFINLDKFFFNVKTPSIIKRADVNGNKLKAY